MGSHCSHHHIELYDDLASDEGERLSLNADDGTPAKDVCHAFAALPPKMTRKPQEGHFSREFNCRHRSARVPDPPASPVTRDPPGGGGAVLRLGRAARRRSDRDRAAGDRRDVEGGREPPTREVACAGQVVALFGRNPFPSKMNRSARSVNRSAITCALSASGNTLGQSLNNRLVVMAVERRYS